MRRSWRGIARSIALTFVMATSLSAQSRDFVTLDLTVGSSVGSGGRRPYYTKSDIAGELTLTVRPHPDRETAAIGALTVGGRTDLGHGDNCVVKFGADTGCLPAYPALAHFGVLGGIERRASILTLRALAGPALYEGDGAAGIGGQFHLDGAIGFTHLALITAARGSLIARFTGETLRFRSVEFGLRVQ